MMESAWSRLGGIDLYRVSVTGTAGGSVSAEMSRCLSQGFAALEAAGCRRADIVRSRLFARDRAARSEASDTRRATLVETMRSASSSFVDAQRLPADARVRLDLYALGPGSSPTVKTVREYDPPIAPPMFVTLGGLVFLSGITDTQRGLATQIDTICAGIRASLARAGTTLSSARRISVYVDRREDPHEARRLCEAALDEAPCTLTLSQVEGYSADEKRIEIEVTAG